MNETAACVCSQPGATPELPERLRVPFLAIRSKWLASRVAT
jgi:hypothetical protein